MKFVKWILTLFIITGLAYAGYSTSTEIKTIQAKKVLHHKKVKAKKAELAAAAASSSSATAQSIAAEKAKPKTLADFVAAHGMSPVQYKIKFKHLSLEDALAKTPDNMETTQEFQQEYHQ